MKRAKSRVEVVRFHKKNLAKKPSHPAYLDGSTEVVPMLDHIILAYVYVELLRQTQHRQLPKRGYISPPMVVPRPRPRPC